MTPKTSTPEAVPTFRELGLNDALIRALDEIGYESPSPIQARTMPHLLEGKDVVGQAQTGTGKTAAFALPVLEQTDVNQRAVQALVLVPTRELAIQVSEAFQRYAAFMPGFHVLPIYGGQGYDAQLRQLRRGVHVVVATPGRLVDHLKRGTLRLESLRWVVLDEADEMLRMGFIDEVEWVLDQTPKGRRVALFSATMPTAIRNIANKYLTEPVSITIKDKTATAATIRQRYWMVSGLHKMDALTRILEAEDFDAMLIFVRTKTATVELSKKLEARGFSCEALSGDVPQRDREAAVARLRDGELDIVVATDVAARGLDVPRISHVVNYDIPLDTESYIHRIGRTGRAGRTGEAILFVAPRERRLLHAIEQATRQRIEYMELPSASAINDLRVAKFKQRILDTLAVEELGLYYQIVEELRTEHNVSPVEIAAALARMVQGDTPLLVATDRGPGGRRRDTERIDRTVPGEDAPDDEDSAKKTKSRKERRAETFGHDAEGIEAEEQDDEAPRSNKGRYEQFEPETDRVEHGGLSADFVAYRIEVGRAHRVQPKMIVGAIANEGGLPGQAIGQIDIFPDYSIVQLPADLPRQVLKRLQRVEVCGQEIRPTLLRGGDTYEWKAQSKGPRGGAGGGSRGPRAGGGKPTKRPRR